MQTKTKVLGGLCALTLGLGISAQATTFDLTFTDFNSELQGVGTVSGTENQNGTFTITSGSWDVLAGPEAGLTGTLVPDASAPNYVYSPSGYFIYDNLLNPNSPGLATVDYYGLLFSTPGSPSEINLYSDNPSQYDEYFNNGVDILGTLNVREVDSSVASTPDGASCATLLGAVFVGMAVVRRSQKA